MGGDAPDAAEPIGPITRQFFRWNLGLARRTDSHSNHLSTTVYIGTDRFTDVGADASETLGKLRRSDAIDR